ncbi:MAG: L-lactate permease [Cytophagaceae bacterium]|jgi:L-lactate permease|nr:L-lactate permease [Cytophagaceae bacterium]
MAVFFSIFLLLVGTFILKQTKIGALAAVSFYIFYLNHQSKWSLDSWISIADGFIITLELSLLLFSALYFYESLQRNHKLSFLNHFSNNPPSAIFLLISFSFFFGSFFEGIAGFGLPAMLLIPMLVSLGFSPISAVTCSLLGTCLAVCFGALGTPLKIGLGIEQPNAITEILLIPLSILLLLHPLVITLVYAYVEKVRVNWKKEGIYVFSAGILFLPFLYITSIFSIEFPSVVAGGMGLVIYLLLFHISLRQLPFLFWIKSFAPFILLIVLLLISKPLLQHIAVSLHPSVRSIQAYQPGIIFLITIGVLFFYEKMNQRAFEQSSIGIVVWKKIQSPVLSIAAMVCLAQLIKHDLSQILQYGMNEIDESNSTYLYPALGMIGSFITGSATMSNVLMRDVIQDTSHAYAWNTALLHVGSALGNIISLQNIVMACSVLSVRIEEKSVLSILFPILFFFYFILFLVSSIYF